MQELDPAARELLRRYRANVGLNPPARTRVSQRLDASLAAVQEPITRPRRRRIAITVALFASFAAVLIAICDLRARLAATGSDGPAAPYVMPPPATRPVVPRAVVDDAPPPQVLPVVGGVESSPRRSTPRATSGLAAELELLRRAQAALDGGDPGGALRLLGEHVQSFADGQLQQDRDLLRIEALCARGDTRAAQARAGDFLRAFPGSTHAAMVRTICAGPANSVTDIGLDRQPLHHD